MVTYVVLNVAFIIITVMLLRLKPHRPSKAWWLTLTLLILLTAIFDSVIVGLNIVGYNTDKIIGIFIGHAPIEDFFYALFACIIVPAIWSRLPSTSKVKKL